MSEVKTLFETLRVSLYEALALLLPGFVLLIVLREYFQKVAIVPVQDVPLWAAYAVVALITGYVLKGITAFAADFYRYALLPFRKRLTDEAKAGVAHPTHLSWAQALFSVNPPVLAWLPKHLRFLPNLPFGLFQGLYVPWREKRVGNKPYFKSKPFQRVREVAGEMFKVDTQTMEPMHLWNICYGAISTEEREKRDRLDATADMLRSLITVAWISAGIVLVRGPWNRQLALLLLIHYVVIGGFYNRVLRYDTLAHRNIFQAFFNQYCRAQPTPGGAPPTPTPPTP